VLDCARGAVLMGLQKNKRETCFVMIIRHKTFYVAMIYFIHNKGRLRGLHLYEHLQQIYLSSSDGLLTHKRSKITVTKKLRSD
jgi:hypothetical protein